MGLLQAMELVEDRAIEKARHRADRRADGSVPRKPDSDRQGRDLTATCLRISPPLNISKTDVDEFARRLDASFAKVSTPRAVAYT